MEATPMYKLSANEYHGWHRGAQGIRADIFKDGEKVGLLVGIASGAGSGGGREFSIHEATDTTLQSIARTPQGNMRYWFSRKELLQDINEVSA
jgi:hypothetical protein